MAEKIEYPRLVKTKKGTFEYQFKLGETQILRVTNLLEAYEFSDGYALVKVYDKTGNPVYRYLGLNGKLSDDSYYMAFDYRAGRALCQLEKDGKVQFRDIDGQLSPQTFDLENTYSYKAGSKEEAKEGIDISNKLNLYGFAVVSVDGKETIANMMGEYPNSKLTKKDVVNRGIELYNFYKGILNLEQLDPRDMADIGFVKYIERLVTYKYNLKMIETLNEGKIEDVVSLLKTKSEDLKFLQSAKTKAMEI